MAGHLHALDTWLNLLRFYWRQGWYTDEEYFDLLNREEGNEYLY